jgi:coatomer subunit beta'
MIHSLCLYYNDSVLALWKNDLKAVDEKAADALADPAKYPNLFPDLDVALKVEKMFLMGRDVHVPASSYPTAKNDLDLNLIEFVKSQLANQPQAASPVVVEAQIASPKSPSHAEEQVMEEEEAEEEPEEEEEVEVAAAAAVEPAAAEGEEEAAAEDEDAALEDELNEMNLSAGPGAAAEEEEEEQEPDEVEAAVGAAANTADGDSDFLEEDW